MLKAVDQAFMKFTKMSMEKKAGYQVQMPFGMFQHTIGKSNF